MAHGDEFQLLVIDDDPVVRESVKNFLQPTLWTITAAENGFKGLEIAVSDPPDLILLDVIMPEMDGLQTLAQLKKMRKTRNIPVVIVTGKIDCETLREASKLGAVSFIGKPFVQADLVRKVAFVGRQAAQTKVQTQIDAAFPDPGMRPSLPEHVDDFFFQMAARIGLKQWEAATSTLEILSAELSATLSDQIAAALKEVERALLQRSEADAIFHLEACYPLMKELADSR